MHEKNFREADGKKIMLWVSLLTLSYVALYYAHYGNTALGLSPGLDNQQTLLLAQQMAEGTLPDEPFHRAPLYPFLLSLFLRIGSTIEALPTIARSINAIALLVCVSVSIRCSLRIWKTNTSAWISGLLFGLNPVILFFAADPFDILLATACMCLALIPAIDWIKKREPKAALRVGLYLAIGASLRSHLLPLLIVWSLVCILTPSPRRALNFFCASAPLLASLLILGFTNYRVSNEFRCLPWQGAYNLWAGNKPNASGKIYTQSINVEFENVYDNPAKLESISLYEKETGKSPPHSIQEMNKHWTDKTMEHIGNHPMEWLSLMFSKAYFFLNNYEQYDNKTYNLHKGLHPPLRWNPLHWGALLVLSVAGTLIGLRHPSKKTILTTLIILFAVYAAGTILFYTPNRFRVPMIPIMCVLAGGIVGIRKAWSEAHKTWKIWFIACLVVTLAIAYSQLLGVSENKTLQEDYAMLSNASLRTERDAEAIHWAQKALNINSQRVDMKSNLIQAKFNHWAFAQNSSPHTYLEFSTLLEESRQAASSDDTIQIITGIYYWKLGNEELARASWIKHRQTDPFAELCLLWTASSNQAPKPNSQKFTAHKNFPLLLAAEAEKKQPTQLTHTLNFIFKQIESQSH